MGRKMDFENWVIEQGMECQAISMEEKYLIKKYNELEEKEDQVFAWLLSQDDELIQKAVLKLKQIDQVQDQIIIRLLECEDRQISGHVHLNKQLGRIKNVEVSERDLLPVS
jgi:succinate dehydrogenase flavin-adding protein (antitoxin of CptAB toxin-antitoxin module)